MPRPSLLERMGLGRPELRAWAMYDWAASSVQTTIMVAVFPIYFVKVAGAGIAESGATQRLATINSIALVIIALASPLLGAISDYRAAKKRFTAIFMGLGVVACGGLFLVGTGDFDLASWLFIAIMVGVAGSYVFYEALLPHIASPGEIDRVSAAGYAVGYLGGGVLLAFNLAWIQMPARFGLPSGEGLTGDEATLPARLAFFSVAVWWALFSIPLLRRVPEPPGDDPGGASIARAFTRLRRTLRELRRYRHGVTMLVAFMLYNDGIGTMIRMGTLFGTQVGIDQGSLIAALLLVQFIGVPSAFAFGAVARRIGAKTAILISLAIYTAISVIAFRMRTATDFFVLAGLVGLVQGGSQALSRSLFASLIPKDRTAEFFGFFAVSEKFAGIFGPLLFSLAVAVTHEPRTAILSVILFFVAGAALLVKVDIEAGRRAAGN
jgi:UMF1 family MFS transporter